MESVKHIHVQSYAKTIIIDCKDGPVKVDFYTAIRSRVIASFLHSNYPDLSVLEVENKLVVPMKRLTKEHINYFKFFTTNGFYPPVDDKTLLDYVMFQKFQKKGKIKSPDLDQQIIMMEAYQYLDLGSEGPINWTKISESAFSNPYYMKYGITRDVILKYFDKLGKSKSKLGYEEDIARIYSGKKAVVYGIRSVEDCLFVVRHLRKEMREIGLIKATGVFKPKDLEEIEKWEPECSWCNYSEWGDSLKTNISDCSECGRSGCINHIKVVNGWKKCWSCRSVAK